MILVDLLSLAGCVHLLAPPVCSVLLLVHSVCELSWLVKSKELKEKAWD